MTCFFIINARCEQCGQDDPDALMHFLDRQNGDLITSRCRNQTLCRERQIERDHRR